MTKTGDYRDFLEYGKPKALNANGFVPISFDLGTHFGDTEAGALELKGDYFLSMAPGDFVLPDFTHLKRLEERTAKWWLSCQDTEPTPEYLNMVVHTACTFSAFVNPFANIEDEVMVAFHWYNVHLWAVDDIIDSINAKVSDFK